MSPLRKVFSSLNPPAIAGQALRLGAIACRELRSSAETLAEVQERLLLSRCATFSCLLTKTLNISRRL